MCRVRRHDVIVNDEDLTQTTHRLPHRTTAVTAMPVMTTPSKTAAAIPTIVFALDSPSTIAVSVAVALVTSVTIVEVPISVATVEDVATFEEVATVDGVSTVEDVATVEGVSTVEGVASVEDVATVEGVSTVEDVLTVDTQVNPTGVDGLHVVPALHGSSSHDFRRSQYQPALKGSHVHSIPVSIPSMSLHVLPFLHGDILQLFCIGHRNVSLDIFPPGKVWSFVSTDVDI